MNPPPRLTMPIALAALLACALLHRQSALASAGAFELCLAAGLGGLILGLGCLRRHARVRRDPAIPARSAAGEARFTAICRLLIVASAFSAMLGWSGLEARRALASRIAPALEGVDLSLDAIIDQMPIDTDYGKRVTVRARACGPEPAATGCRPGLRARLAWRAPPDGLAPGQRWQLEVRLKRPHAPQNDGLFDAEQRALEDGVDASGSIRGARLMADDAIDWLDGPAAWRIRIERWRQHLAQVIRRALPDANPDTRGILMALVIGDSSALGNDAWERFNRVGVGHLLSVSGLHVTMLAGLGGGLCGRLWRHAGLARLFCRITGRMPVQWLIRPKAAWLAGVATAFLYAALSGWGIPAQRTCWMLATAGLATLTGRPRAPSVILAITALAVMILDPWSPLAAGFWLSFGAVTAIVWAGQRRRPGGLPGSACSKAPAPSGRPRWSHFPSAASSLRRSRQSGRWPTCSRFRGCRGS